MPPPTTAPVLRQNPALKSDYERCKNDPACSYNYCAAEAKQADCEQDYLNCNAFVLGDKSSIKRQSCQNGNKYSIVMRTCVSESTCEQSRQD
uniref:Chitin-binding type-2 domain-containing protein n=1 Tax=Romanomermis culicivorax TaxID=13658 RepID=A0A915KJK8_ROMCU